jgi:hypothetical protein
MLKHELLPAIQTEIHKHDSTAFVVEVRLRTTFPSIDPKS